MRLRISWKHPDTDLADIVFAVFREVLNDDHPDDTNARDGILLPHKDSIIERAFQIFGILDYACVHE